MLNVQKDKDLFFNYAGSAIYKQVSFTYLGNQSVKGFTFKSSDFMKEFWACYIQQELEIFCPAPITIVREAFLIIIQEN